MPGGGGRARLGDHLGFPGEAALLLRLGFEAGGGGVVVGARGSVHSLQCSPRRGPLPALRAVSALIGSGTPHSDSDRLNTVPAVNGGPRSRAVSVRVASLVALQRQERI